MRRGVGRNLLMGGGGGSFKSMESIFIDLFPNILYRKCKRLVTVYLHNYLLLHVLPGT